VKIEYPPGATPLEAEDLEQLIPTLSTQRQLNEFEARNILKAEQWARGSSRLRGQLLSVSGLLQLHQRMFGDTWKWAGRYRTRDTNIGIDWRQIQEQVPALCGDVRYWVENRTWPWHEIAVRLHHRLALIHPFVNGNGRHARLAADLLLEWNGQPRLGWGSGSLVEQSERRAEYIAAIQEADRGSLERLLRFAQSK